MNRNREIWKGFVVIEGIDGAGTTTLTKNLTLSLENRNVEVIAGCEPTDGPIGTLVRQGLSGETPVEPESLALLFAADRREHLFGGGGIRSIIDSGKVYISDRYLFSSLAYQTLDCPWEWVDNLNSTYPLPSHLIHLGLPVEVAMKRLEDRTERDIYETRSLQEKVSTAYDRALDEFGDSGMRILRIDSRHSPEETCRDAFEFLADLY